MNTREQYRQAYRQLRLANQADMKEVAQAGGLDCYVAQKTELSTWIIREAWYSLADRSREMHAWMNINWSIHLKHYSETGRRLPTGFTKNSYRLLHKRI